MKWNFGYLKCFVLSLLFCGTLCLLQSLGICSSDSETKTTKGNNVMQTTTDNDTPFACNMTAFNAEQKKRVLELLKELKTKRREIKELPDGYAFRYAMDSGTLRDAAEFITYERLCCPFFDFDLEVEKDNGALWFKLGGRDGLKDFIKLEFDV